MIKRRNVILWNGGSDYRIYVFKESIRHYVIDHKGRGRKEVIYLRVADVRCTRGVRESTGLSYGGPAVGFRDSIFLNKNLINYLNIYIQIDT